ncbi:MAG: DNA primase [Clostridia bacterium]|nr:DNA primase [Clostridia bacterium]
MIPANIIEDIKFRNEIEHIISQHVVLKRAGSNYSGLCPFHSEKTPSFVVFPGTQSFYCFGCGAGGDVISFTMRTENLDYMSAIKVLAKRSGITIPEDVQADRANGVSRQRVLDMNKEAAKFFRNTFFDEKQGAAARDYIFNKRKLSMATVKHFGIGFAPNSFGALHDHLKKLGYSDNEMVEGFLCSRGKNNSVYDLFRNRVIFPIIDVSGNVVAFGGRVMDNSEPKYLNTSDTPAFKKSKNLFALNYAKNKCEKMLILCEGYMDVIALHAAGFENAVATLGTAITSEQARIFSRYTKKVVISYDSDKAGQRAADKAFKLLQEVGIDVKILNMSGAKDPDEYIQRFGANKFSQLLDESKTRIEFELDKLLLQYDVNNVEDKIKISALICNIIATYHSNVERELYCKYISDKLDIPLESLKRDVAYALKRGIREEKSTQMSEIYRASSGNSDKVNPESSSNMKASKAEEAILGMMQLHEEHLKKCIDTLSPDDFVTSFNKRVFTKILTAYITNGKFDLAFIEEDFNINEISRITKMVVDRQKLDSNGTEILDAYIQSLKAEKNREDAETNFGSLENLFKNKK